MTTSVDIAGRCINAKCALRLRESGYIKGFEQGQAVTLSRSRSAPVRKKVLFAAIVGTLALSNRHSCNKAKNFDEGKSLKL